MAVPRKKVLNRPRGGEGEERITPDIVRAAKKNNLRGVIDALAEDPSCVNSFDTETHMTALHWACANRNTKIFNTLVDHPGIKLEPVSKTGKKPAQLALESSAPNLADQLHRRIFIQDHLSDDPFDESTNVEKFDPREP